jgi:hypothetical protein
MTRLLSKLLVATALLSGPARADTLTIGYWDQALGGGVTQLATSPGTPIQLLGNPLMLGTGFGFDQITTLLIPPSQSGLGGGPRRHSSLRLTTALCRPREVQSGSIRLGAGP